MKQSLCMFAREQAKPYTAMERQQITSYGREMHPHERVHAPFHPIGTVESGSALAVESNDSCFHIAHLAVFVAQITVTTKHHIVAVNLYDSVKNEVQRIGLGKHRVAHLGVGTASC